MVKRPTGSGGEPSSPNCGVSAGGKARQLPSPVAASVLPTLREVYVRWTQSKRSRSNDSVEACGRALALFESYAGNLPLDKITRLLGDGFRAWLQDDARLSICRCFNDKDRPASPAAGRMNSRPICGSGLEGTCGRAICPGPGSTWASRTSSMSWTSPRWGCSRPVLPSQRTDHMDGGMPSSCVANAALVLALPAHPATARRKHRAVE